MAKKKGKPVELAEKGEGLTQASLFGDDAPTPPDTSGENEKLNAEQMRYLIHGRNDYKAMMDATWRWRRHKSGIEKTYLHGLEEYNWRLKPYEVAALLKRVAPPEMFGDWLELSILIAANEAVHYADYPSKRT